MSRRQFFGHRKVLSMGVALACSLANAQEVLPFPPTPTASVVGKTLAQSQHHWRKVPSHLPADAPNILVIMLDDAGFANPDTFGGEIHTPTLTRLAKTGIAYNAFHTTAISSSTRAALLTGRNHHHVGTGMVTEAASDFPGYTGIIPKSAATVAEVLKDYGYSTAAFGKWHNTPPAEVSPAGPFNHFPTSYGFQHFYGFLAGETDQYHPRLWNDTTPIEPPNDPKYHLTVDLANKAIGWMREHRDMAPDKPFFMYWAPGAVHAPHQIFKSWADKYKGKFDSGWDVYRQTVFARQKAIGWIPKDTQLTPRPSTLPAWNSLPPAERKFQSRLMEVYAGFLEHTDTQAGRLIDELDREGIRKNTLIFYIFSDNGASAEGLQGSLNDIMSLEGFSAPPAQQMKILNSVYGGLGALGGPKLHEHYNAAWAWAGETPFVGTKLVAGYFGGTRTPLVISWPEKIKHDGIVRDQFHHVNDIVPTIYKILHITPPEVVNGVKQMPLDGVSLAYTFSDPKAKTRKPAQYFEVLGSRGLYQDGWMASVFGPRVPWLPGPQGLATWNPAQDKWALFKLSHDYSQADDLSARYPVKLAEMEKRFDQEARKNNVYPLGAGFLPLMIPNFEQSSGRTDWHLDASATRLPEVAAPNVRAQSSLATADVDIPADANGVIYAVGDISGGVTVYLKDGHLNYEYNALALQRTRIRSTEALKPGHNVLEVETHMLGKQRGAPAEITLRVNGQQVGQAKVPVTVPLIFTASETFDVGVDLGSPVSLDYFDQAPFRFDGTINDLHIVYQQ